MKTLVAARAAAVGLLVSGATGLVAALVRGQVGPWQAGPLRLEAGLANLALLSYVGGLMWLVTRYCAVNLRGQHRLSRFGSLGLVVTASLAAMVLAGNLFTLALGWTGSGVALAGLVAHSGHPSARRAARMVLSWMLGASAVMWLAVVAAERSGLALDGTDAGSSLGSVDAAVVAALLVSACLVRSAMVPFHRWLPETAEAPSPVSALLHAGIVNATGIVAVLQWPLLRAQPLVMVSLGVLGLASVAWCSLEQRVRPDVKGRLASSTSAQMGWMAVQVGVGAPAAALLHLMGHGSWKAWHFLRAGGAVARARREPVVRHRPTTVETVAATSVALVPVVGVSGAVLAGQVTLSPSFLLVSGLGVLAAVLIGREAAALERSRSHRRGAIALVGGMATAVYVAAAATWDHGVASGAELTHAGHRWSVLLAAGAVATAALLAVLGPRVRVTSTHPVATLLSATSVVPGARLAGPGSPTGMASEARVSAADARTTVAIAAKMVGPVWPLRATVAANPLARLEILPFDTAVLMAERFYGTSLRPSLAWFLELYDAGVITPGALGAAAERHGPPLGPERGGAAGVLAATRRAADGDGVSGTTHGDAGSSRPRPADLPAAWPAHAHTWSARAWHRADDSHADLRGPWRLWKQCASHRTYDLAARRRGLSRFVRSLPDDPAEAIGELLARSGRGHHDAFEVVTRLLAAGPGWAAHAQWRSRRCGTSGPLLELVALRLALAVLDGGRGLAQPSTGRARAADSLDVLRQIWQGALDASERDRVCDQLSLGGDVAETPGPLVSQSVWCIDVRSERFRRHLEGVGRHETLGFAGFFGILGRSRHPDGTSFDQCPVIVTPTVALDVRDGGIGWLAGMVRVATRVTGRPGVAFAVAEAAGPGTFLSALAATLAPRRWHRVATSAAPTMLRGSTEVSLRELADPRHELSLEQRVEAAEGMLRTIGLTRGFAPVLLLCAHGSTTENNAFMSAYDCGACGGNPGVLNALSMAGVLNDPEVRDALARRGITIPSTTRVLAAQHDTTTDRVSVLTRSLEDQAAAALVERDLTAAGRGVAAERSEALPVTGRSVGARDVASRAVDWAEPMPEWGLSGCAAIVVGSRRLTRRADLRGRVFLHSYDREQDADGAVLAGILNAPVVVSQWIASQYWFSTAAPTALGAGDKTTHNVVGDVGVTTGAHGDLRVGLPWQATFASDPHGARRGTHESLHVPSRHLVVIEGDPAHIVRSVAASETLRHLISHEWMRLVAVNRDGVLELRPSLEWDPLPVGHLEERGQR